MTAGQLEYMGDGKRRRVEIGGENYYILLSDEHLDITIPYENRKGANERQRVLINKLCKEVSKLMKLRNKENVALNGEKHSDLCLST